MQVLASGQLRIIHASPEDAGNYFCIAQNSVGSAVGKTRLVVQGRPREGDKVGRRELGALRLLRATPFPGWLWSLGGTSLHLPLPQHGLHSRKNRRKTCPILHQGLASDSNSSGCSWTLVWSSSFMLAF